MFSSQPATTAEEVVILSSPADERVDREDPVVANSASDAEDNTYSDEEVVEEEDYFIQEGYDDEAAPFTPPVLVDVAPASAGPSPPLPLREAVKGLAPFTSDEQLKLIGRRVLFTAHYDPSTTQPYFIKRQYSGFVTSLSGDVVSLINVSELPTHEPHDNSEFFATLDGYFRSVDEESGIAPGGAVRRVSQKWTLVMEDLCRPDTVSGQPCCLREGLYSASMEERLRFSSLPPSRCETAAPPDQTSPEDDDDQEAVWMKEEAEYFAHARWAPFISFPRTSVESLTLLPDPPLHYFHLFQEGSGNSRAYDLQVLSMLAKQYLVLCAAGRNMTVNASFHTFLQARAHPSFLLPADNDAPVDDAVVATDAVLSSTLQAAHQQLIRLDGEMQRASHDNLRENQFLRRTRLFRLIASSGESMRQMRLMHWVTAIAACEFSMVAPCMLIGILLESHLSILQSYMANFLLLWMFALLCTCLLGTCTPQHFTVFRRMRFFTFLKVRYLMCLLLQTYIMVVILLGVRDLSDTKIESYLERQTRQSLWGLYQKKECTGYLVPCISSDANPALCGAVSDNFGPDYTSTPCAPVVRSAIRFTFLPRMFLAFCAMFVVMLDGANLMRTLHILRSPPPATADPDAPVVI